jgi:hypothetical protein
MATQQPAPPATRNASPAQLLVRRCVILVRPEQSLSACFRPPASVRQGGSQIPTRQTVFSAVRNVRPALH